MGTLVSGAYLPGTLSGAFVPRWAVVAVMIPLLSKLDFRNLPASVLAVLCFVVGCAGISLIETPDLLAGLYDAIFLVILLLVFVAGAGMEKMDDLMIGLAAGLIVSSALVIPQYFGWVPVTQTSAQPAGLFFNSEVLAEFAVLVLIWGIVRRNWWVVVASALPVAICESRTAWIALGASLVYAYKPRSNWLLISALGVLFIAAVSAVLWLGPMKIASADHRITLWIATALALEPFGNGLGWFQVAHPIERYAHSDALQIITEIGLGGLALLVIPFMIFKEKTHVAERAVFIAVCVEILVSFPLHMPATGFVAAIISGFLLSRRNLVHMGQFNCGLENVCGLQREVLPDAVSTFRSRLGSLAISIRSLFARRQGERTVENIAGGIA